MDALRGIIDKVGNKSNDDDKHLRSSPDTGSAYRSSDVGTKSYSRGKGDSRNDWDDRRKSDPDTSSPYSSRAGGGSGYSSGSSRNSASGLGSERSLTGNAGRDNDPNDSMMSGEGSSSNTTVSSSENFSGVGRHNTKKHSRQSDNYDKEEHSSYSRGANVRDDDTSEMSRGRGTRGEYGHTSHFVGENTSGGKPTYDDYN